MQREVASWQGIGFQQWDPAILPVCLQSSLAILFLTAVYIVSKPIEPAWGTCGMGTFCTLGTSLDGCWFFHCETWPWSGGFGAGQVHSPKMQVFQSHERHFMLVFWQWCERHGSNDHSNACQDLSECWEVLTRPGWHAPWVRSEFSVSQVFQSQIPILRSHQDYGVYHGVGSTRTS